MSTKEDIFARFERRNLSARNMRLLNEWKAIHQMLLDNRYIKYIIRHTNRDELPDEYEIVYNIKSITGVEQVRDYRLKENGQEVVKQLRRPVYGNEHKMQIRIPPDYPNAVTGKPTFKMITDVWHPNIRYFGDLKGRICLNESNLDAGNTLADRVMDVAFYLKFERYFAINEPPFPEDEDVALWVREEAEPNKWLAPDGSLPTDDCDIYEKITKAEPIKNVHRSDYSKEFSGLAVSDDIEVVDDYELEQQGMITPDWADDAVDNEDEDRPFEC